MDSIFDEDVDEVGGEIEAYCPSSRCKADTTHTIISMYEDEVRRVQCVVCGEIHAYRKPRGEAYDDPVEPAPVRKKLSRKPTWEEAMSQVSEDELTNCRPYSIRDTYQELDIVSHPTFGVGFVTELLPDNKVEISFRDEQRILVHNRGDLAEKMPGLSNTPPPREEKKKKRKKRNASSLVKQFQQAAAEAEAEDRTASIKQAAEQLRAKRRREPDVMDGDDDFGDELEIDEVSIKTELARRAAAEKSSPKGPGGRGKKAARPVAPEFIREPDLIAPALFDAEGDAFADLGPDIDLFGAEPDVDADDGEAVPALPPAKRVGRAPRKGDAARGAAPLVDLDDELEPDDEAGEADEDRQAPVRKPTRRARKAGAAAAPAGAAGTAAPEEMPQETTDEAPEAKKAAAAPGRTARGAKAASKEVAAAREAVGKKAASKKAAKDKAADQKAADQPPAAKAADKKAARDKAPGKKAAGKKAADEKAASKKPAAAKAAGKAKPSAGAEKASKAGAKKASRAGARKPAAAKAAARKPAAAKAASQKPPKSAGKPAPKSAGKPAPKAAASKAAAAKARPAAAKAAPRKASAGSARGSSKASAKAAGGAAKRGVAPASDKAADKKKGSAARTPAAAAKAGKDKAAKRPAARAKKRA